MASTLRDRMGRIDTLPADQKAVLQLLLRQGRSYDELSGLLRLDQAAVRRRAHDALAALGPHESDLPPERRNEVADYLLGQDAEDQRLVTYGFLEGSASARAWARVVAGELRELAGDGLPTIPAEGRDDAARTPAPAPPPVAAALATPLAAAPAAAPAVAPAAAATPDADAAGDDDGDAGADFGDEPGEPRLAGGPRSSRLGGALLLGGVALAAIVVALFVFVFNGDDSKKDPKTTASTTTTAPQAQVEAEATLAPPAGRTGLKNAAGLVLVQRSKGQSQIVAAVQGLPKPKTGGYGIWLYSGPGKATWLGFFTSQDQQGRLVGGGKLSVPISDYREVLVTREAKGNPARPGPIFLRGTVQAGSSAAGG